MQTSCSGLPLCLLGWLELQEGAGTRSCMCVPSVLVYRSNAGQLHYPYSAKCKTGHARAQSRPRGGCGQAAAGFRGALWPEPPGLRDPLSWTPRPWPRRPVSRLPRRPGAATATGFEAARLEATEAVQRVKPSAVHSKSKGLLARGF